MAQPRRSHRSPWLAALLLATGTSLAATFVTVPAQAAVVERVVAVVGEKAILLSDLRARARPFLVRIHQQIPAGAQRAAQISQLLSEVLDQMIDEQLEQKAANRAHIVVTAAEVDAAIARVAAQNGIEVETLVAEAVKSGMTEQAYRKEIRRQVLDAKLMNLRLQGRIRVTEDDLRTEYRSIVLEERRRQRFRAAWITLELPQGASTREVTTVREEAERLAKAARQGADFATLAREHSADAETRASGGLMPEMVPGRLPPALDRAILGLEVGEVSTPMRVGDQLVIITVVERAESELPTYAEARPELENRVYLKKMDVARRRWLDQLRRSTHIEVRL